MNDRVILRVVFKLSKERAKQVFLLIDTASDVIFCFQRVNIRNNNIVKILAFIK